ncbi:class D sortase [Alkaliphilus hydrothermalis]|uniref:Sortase A n=1 Tax=Alkaliphilus hydrothermalis TaxID=1482730 RepID=A0ABS2NPA0_9FIRM|nr:class D sortase [Alkaliphilus hydrothermalis]MBM7614774.1 sortase A [Alkaliphilus hydrothermalis]
MGLKKISFVLILLGVVIAMYPFLESGYTWYWQQKIMREYESQQEIRRVQDKMKDRIEENLQENTIEFQEYHDLQEIFQEETSQGLQELYVSREANSQESSTSVEKNRQTEIEQETGPSPQTEKKSNNNKTHVIGILKISKINLNLPILQGATEKNLKIGAAVVRGTTPLGDIGNTALAGHRSHTYGRFFNRLDELEVGDQILIEKEGEIYQYKIYKKHIVIPEDVTVLNRNNKDQILTLVTCHPLYTSTHRLIIHAVYKKKDKY